MSTKLLVWMYNTEFFALHSIPFLWKRITKIVSKETFLNLSEPIIYDILRFYPTNLTYIEHMMDEEKIFNIVNRIIHSFPKQIKYIINPPEEFQLIAIKDLPLNITNIHNPTSYVIITALINRWSKPLYSILKDQNLITEEVEKKINKLKLELGPMHDNLTCL